MGIWSLASSSSNDDNMGVVTVPPSALEGEPSDEEMVSVGFVGQQGSKQRSGVLYLDAWRVFLEDHDLSPWPIPLEIS